MSCCLFVQYGGCGDGGVYLSSHYTYQDFNRGLFTAGRDSQKHMRRKSQVCVFAAGVHHTTNKCVRRLLDKFGRGTAYKPDK